MVIDPAEVVRAHRDKRREQARALAVTVLLAIGAAAIWLANYFELPAFAVALFLGATSLWFVARPKSPRGFIAEQEARERGRRWFLWW